MTLAIPGIGGSAEANAADAPVGASGSGPSGVSETERAKRAQAARQFEGVLLTQLMKVMRKSVPMLQGGQGRLYMQMFDGAMADEMAKGGGIGLAPVIERALGGDGRMGKDALAEGEASARALSFAMGARRYGASEAQALGGAHAAQPVELAGDAGVGRVRQLQGVAAGLITQSGERWSKAGALRPEDLSSDFSTDDAHFNVMDAAGYQGHPKCNLFAFEVARRAGFQVPVVPRAAGWGYPSADAVTAQAASGEIDAGWARVVTGASREALSAGTQSGQSALMLTGSGTGSRAGHMAIVERIHEVDYDANGRVRKVVFDGWEARTKGAQYLTRRTWNRSGVTGGHQVRSGFGRIELLELAPADPGERPERPQSDAAPASLRDNSRSRDPNPHPIYGSEDAS